MATKTEKFQHEYLEEMKILTNGVRELLQALDRRRGAARKPPDKTPPAATPSPWRVAARSRRKSTGKTPPR